MENNQMTNNQDEVANAAFIFARSLSLIFKDNEGIIVDVPENLLDAFETPKLIVLKTNDKVSIFNFNQDLPEGTSVSLSDNES